MGLVQRRRHSGRYPRALQAAARLQASRGTSDHDHGLREPFISAVLKTSLTLRPSGRLDAWRRQFDAKEDEMVVAAARGGRGHGLEQRERLGLAARHLRMATRARPSGRGFRRHGCCKGPGGQKRSFCPRDHHGYWSRAKGLQRPKAPIQLASACVCMAAPATC